MRKDQTATMQQLTMYQEEADLMSHLYSFSQSPPFNADLQAAFILFWNDHQAPGALRALEPLDMARFFDWYVTDQRTSKERRRIIDLFANREGPQLRPVQLDILRARQEALLSLYKLLEVKGNELVLTDLLRSGEHSVQGDAWSRVATAGDLLLTRVIELEDNVHITRAATLLPPQAETGILRYVRAHFERYREEHFGTDWDDFLRESSYLFNHYLLSENAESWRTAVKSPSPYYDGIGVRERLTRALEEPEPEGVEEDLPEQGPSPIVVPGDLITEQHEKDSATQKTFTVSHGGILLPGRPEPEEREESPSILVPGRDS
jgi:hypothetical protein